MSVSIPATCLGHACHSQLPHPRLPAQTHGMASVKRHVAALGSERFFEDHPSLLPGQGVGQAEAPLPAMALC